MKELTIGETNVRVRATPLALLYYKQEFKSDLLGDLVKMEAIKSDPSKLDSVALLQLIWAMAKADAHPNQFPSFENWLSTFTSFDFSDPCSFPQQWRKLQMAFFVEESKGNKSNKDRDQERLDLELIAIGKRSRLSMAEINEFRVKDLLAYAKIYAGVEEDKSRLATQKDIDSFYAN